MIRFSAWGPDTAEASWKRCLRSSSFLRIYWTFTGEENLKDEGNVDIEGGQQTSPLFEPRTCQWIRWPPHQSKSSASLHLFPEASGQLPGSSPSSSRQQLPRVSWLGCNGGIYQPAIHHWCYILSLNLKSVTLWLSNGSEDLGGSLRSWESFAASL